MNEILEREICSACNGTGNSREGCAECLGDGWVDSSADGNPMTCPVCSDRKCSVCKGTGDKYVADA